VYVYSSSMAQYVLGTEARSKLMQFAELDSDKWRQYAAQRRGLSRWGLGRWIYAREADKLLAFEDRGRPHLHAFAGRQRGRTRAVPAGASRAIDPDVLCNGVDVGHFTSTGDQNRHVHTAVFTGVMDYEPNVDGVSWFVEQCWPTLRQRFPDARLLVVGSNPVVKVQALARVGGVTVTGRVPSTPPFFDQAAVAIAPLRLARGVQNKVLEAMSMALPVVSSSAALAVSARYHPATS
jgi:glycosyltransferase involved in cell wall biosynthesis